MTQSDLAVAAGVGVKTISSFESGVRVGSLRVLTLSRILCVYGMTWEDFFGARQPSIPLARAEDLKEVAAILRDLPSEDKATLLLRLRQMANLARIRKGGGTHGRK
jgi:transcriptional regulator with XRE-family HTH domain